MTSTVTRRRFVKRTATGVGVAAVGTGLGAGIFAPPAATAAGESTGSTVFGPVTVASTDSRYADLRRGTNQRFEGNPESIRLVGSTSQVVAAVQSAVSAGKKIAVRSGGHCYEDFVANAAVKVVIDLSAMNAVGFDSGRNAFVIEAGAKLGQVYERLFKGWGVTVPGGACPTVGAGGHIQGGGYGALSRRYGLISDHLYAVEVVVVDRTGTAKAVVATREAGDPNRDLWWAHTGGGGGNFGVVTRYWMRTPGATGSDPSKLLPKAPSEVWISTVNWPWAGLTKDGFGRLMKNYAQWHIDNSAPGSAQLSLFSELKPSHRAAGAISLTVQVEASAPGAEQMLDDFVAYVGAGTGVTAQVADHRKVPWLHATQWSGFTGPDPLFRFKGKPAYQRKNFTAAQLDAMYKHLTRTDYEYPAALMLISAYAGKVNEVGPADTAVAQRDSILKVQTAVLWTDAADDAKHLAWVREFFRDLYSETGGVPGLNGVTDGMFINYADADVKDPAWNASGTPWQQLYYKGNYAALQQAKAKWDPRNTFSHALSVELPS
ncbi:FAD-binding oxidoreductase [Streptomyces xanthochromogenes]